MRRLIAIGSILAVTMIAAPANAADPLPPAEWRMPAGTKYIGKNIKGNDCWRWWKITKCLPNGSSNPNK